MCTRLTTGLLACLMASLLVGCASSTDGLIRGQSPSAYPMPAGAYSGHGFGAYSQGVPFPFNGLLGKAVRHDVENHVNAYNGTNGMTAYGGGGMMSGGFPVSSGYPAAVSEDGTYPAAGGDSGATCENQYCEDPYCRPGYCQNGCWNCFGGCWHGHNNCPYCNGQGCPRCRGNGNGNGMGEQWAPTHVYGHMYKIPQNMVYPQNPTPGAITVYPYYTHKGPDDFFYPPLKK